GCAGQCSFASTVWPILSSPDRSNVQSVCEGTAVRGRARQTPAPCSSEHEGSPMKVTLIDYGVCNVTSVERALQRLGAASIRATTPAGIAGADALILPGVGHYAALIRALDEHALRGPLVEAIARGVPF